LAGSERRGKSLSEEPGGDEGAGGDDGRWDGTIREINGCPYYRLLGMRVVAMGDGYARLEMPVEEKLLQIYGGVHGGATASLADSAVAVALISASSPEEKAFTVELKLNYLAPVSRGQLIAEARLFHRGRTIAAGDVEVRSDGGRLVAKGIATYMPVRE
jgi:uncharacterized protein (TIGR00369 family)